MFWMYSREPAELAATIIIFLVQHRRG